MKPAFHPRLINDPFSDPGLFIPFMFQRRALMFDLGDLSRLSARELMKVSHVFVTHMHMDHFIGFDQLLRLFLGRDKEIHLFGPTGFLEKVEAKLASYTWNLIKEYENTLVIKVSEIQSHQSFVKTYTSGNCFRPVGALEEYPFTGSLLSEKWFSVDAVIVDHKIDCLGLSVKEHFSVNIIKEGLEELGLPVGPWLREFKDALHEGRDSSEQFSVRWHEKSKFRREKTFTIGELAERITKISPGQKITYLVDMLGSAENIEKAVHLAAGSQHLFIEAPFLDRDREIAQRKYHLTAREAGLIASLAGVKDLTIFHFSPRYSGREEELINEANKVFQKAP
ncbi:MAG: ribonuclease Z [Thermodesulfobacteriota bacterium]